MEKRIKNLLLLIILFSSTIGVVNGQSSDILLKSADPNTDYYQIKTELDTYTKSLSTTDTATLIKESKKIARWDTYWATRVNNGDPNQVGNFNIVSIANRMLAQNQINIGSINGNCNWELVGPMKDVLSSKILTNNGHIYIGDTISQNMGLVSAIHPTGNFNGTTNKKLYAGSNTGGLFANGRDNGEYWELVKTNNTPGMGIIDIEQRRDASPNCFYISTGKNRYNQYVYGFGILTNRNNGTWETLSEFPGHEYSICNDLILDTVGDVFNIYAAVDDVVFKSTDDGLSWTAIYTIPNANGRKIDQLIFKPDNNNTLYLVTNGKKDSQGVYNPEIWYTTNIRSATSNSDWNIININPNTVSCKRMEIDISAADPNNIIILSRDFVLADSSINIKLLKYNSVTSSIDTLIYGINSAVEGINHFKMELAVSDLYPDTIFVGGLFPARVIVNNDNTVSCTYNKQYIDAHPDIRFMETFVNKEGNEFLFIGTDGGVSYSSDHMNNIVNLNEEGLSIAQYYGMHSLESDPEIFAAGGIDNGFRYMSKTLDKGYDGCDGYDLIINRKKTNLIYSTLLYGNMFFPPVVIDTETNMIKALGISNVSVFEEATSERRSQDVPIEVNRKNPNNVFYGYKNIYSIVDNPNNIDDNVMTKYFDILALDSNLSNVQAFKFAPSNPDIAYIAYQNPTWTISDRINKLWRTTDGGTTWTNITTNLKNVIKWNGLSDIAISAKDPNKVWVTFTGYSDSQYLGNKNRVYFTEDGGVTWRDYSQGLSAFPVNRIKCVESNDMDQLFIATDIGIYTNNKIDTVWKRLGHSLEFPFILCTDLEINYGTKQLMVSTYGNGVWKTSIDIDCGTNPNKTISNTQVWDEEMYFSGHITIESGGSLTLENTNLYMDENTRIIIETGGKLYVNNSKISSQCGMWYGITVKGNFHLSQFPISNQGYLNMYNNSTIENAIIGVDVSSKSTFNIPFFKKAGGIMRIKDSKFVNNQIAINMSEYRHTTTNGFIQHNLSNITNVDFETNSALKNTNYTFNTFIKLSGVNKLYIRDCKLTNSYKNNAANAGHGIGITAFNSNIMIKGSETKFTNLEKGVSAYANMSNLPFIIENAAFENIPKAVYISAISNAKITQCNFTMDNEESYGLYLDNCNGYTIEQNTFNAPASSSNKIAGMVVNNSGTDANEVYNNYFNSIPAGLLAQHDNYGNNYDNGLQIKCNDFNECSQDIAVTKDATYTGITGVGTYQGANIDNSTLAGNTFSHKCFSVYFGDNAYSDYNNAVGTIISKYYHHNGNVSDSWVPKYYTYGDESTGLPQPQTQIVPEKAIGISYTKTQSCPDRQISNNGISITNLYSNLNNMHTQLNSANLILKIFEDGGNEELHEEIAFAYSWETYLYYNELMLASPYLSDETMMEAVCNTDLLPNNILKLILLANPQCSRNDELMQMLWERIPAMSESDMEQILQKQSEYSPIDELKANVAYYTHERKRYINLIENTYLQDTINEYAMDSLVNLLSRENDINTKYKLANLYLQKEDHGMVSEVLENIDPSEFSKRELYEYNEFISYFSIMNSIIENNLSFSEISEEQKHNLYNLAASIYLPSAYARSYLLQYDEEYSYTEPVIFPSISAKRMAKVIEEETSVESFIKVYPNPAKDYISVDYKLDNNKGRLEIVDNIGRILYCINDLSLNGTELIHLSKFSPGIYKIVFYSNGEITETKQFSVIK